MRKHLYLRFETEYLNGEGAQGVYINWVHIPPAHNDGVTTDKEFIEVCQETQVPIFKEAGLNLKKVTLQRTREFEYQLYKRANKERVNYHEEKMRQSGWKV